MVEFHTAAHPRGVIEDAVVKADLPAFSRESSEDELEKLPFIGCVV